MRTLAILCTVTVLIVSVPHPAHAQDDEASWLLTQINILRQRNGLGPLAIDGQLAAAATSHSQYLATHPYGHPHIEANGSTPQSRAIAAGYPGKVGENVVGGSSANVRWALDWWIKSPIHLHNILTPWTHVGIGIVNGPYGRYYTTLFGAEVEAPPAPAIPPVVAAATDAPGSTPVVTVAGATSAFPRPTRRPTQVPSVTPSITLTPSITFTPLPTLTPSLTPTGRPPTATAIVLEISPQPTDIGQPAAQAAGTTVLTKPPAVVAMVITPGEAPLLPAAKAAPGDPIRTLLPWVFVLQGVVVAGLVGSAVLRRRHR